MFGLVFPSRSYPLYNTHNDLIKSSDTYWCRERGDMFEDLVMGLEKKEKERLKLNRADNLAAFRTLLEETDTYAPPPTPLCP